LTDIPGKKYVSGRESGVNSTTSQSSLSAEKIAISRMAKTKGNTEKKYDSFFPKNTTISRINTTEIP
jgi:hypothetical protein